MISEHSYFIFALGSLVGVVFALVSILLWHAVSTWKEQRDKDEQKRIDLGWEIHKLKGHVELLVARPTKDDYNELLEQNGRMLVRLSGFEASLRNVEGAMAASSRAEMATDKRLDWLVQTFNEREEKINAKITLLETHPPHSWHSSNDARYDAINLRLDKVCASVGDLTERHETLTESVGGQRERMDRMGVDASTHLNTLDKRIEDMNARIGVALGDMSKKTHDVHTDITTRISNVLRDSKLAADAWNEHSQRIARISGIVDDHSSRLKDHADAISLVASDVTELTPPKLRKRNGRSKPVASAGPQQRPRPDQRRVEAEDR